MTAIQIILIVALLLAGIYGYIKFQNAIIDAIIILVFIGSGIVFVLFPQITTKIANKLGVGRGADLIIYLSIVFFLFVLLRLYARIRKLEQMITKIVRDNAMQSAGSGIKNNDQ